MSHFVNLTSGTQVQHVKSSELTPGPEQQGVKPGMLLPEPVFQGVKCVAAEQMPNLESSISYRVLSEPQIPDAKSMALPPGR